MTLYEVLGVRRDAAAAEVRRAYLDLARRHHPDQGSGGDAARMAEVNAAWEVLGDPRRRAHYDETLDAEPVVRDRPEAEPFRPYDRSPDPPPMPAEDLAPPSTGQRVMTMAPASFFVAAVACLAFGLATGFVPLLVLGLICLFGTFASFVLVPVMSMISSMKDDPDRR